MMKPDAEIIEELARRDAEATPGEWYVDTPKYADAPTGRVVRSGVRVNACTDITCHPTTDRDAALIAAMRNALPRLLELARDAVQDVGELELALRALDKAESRAEALNIQLQDTQADYGAVEYDRDRLLAALKAEATVRAQRHSKHGIEIGDADELYATVGGITFRVTRNASGELVAEEVQP